MNLTHKASVIRQEGNNVEYVIVLGLICFLMVVILLFGTFSGALKKEEHVSEGRVFYTSELAHDCMNTLSLALTSSPRKLDNPSDVAEEVYRALSAWISDQMNGDPL